MEGFTIMKGMAKADQILLLSTRLHASKQPESHFMKCSLLSLKKTGVCLTALPKALLGDTGRALRPPDLARALTYASS